MNDWTTYVPCKVTAPPVCGSNLRPVERKWKEKREWGGKRRKMARDKADLWFPSEHILCNHHQPPPPLLRTNSRTSLSHIRSGGSTALDVPHCCTDENWTRDLRGCRSRDKGRGINQPYAATNGRIQGKCHPPDTFCARRDCLPVLPPVSSAKSQTPDYLSIDYSRAEAPMANK